MPLSRGRARFVIACLLAVPVLLSAYAASVGGRLWSTLRQPIAVLLGATIVGSIYAEEAYRRTATPLRAGAVGALALALIAPSFAAPAPVAAADPADAVVAAARNYLGSNYRMGSEGPTTFDCSGLLYRIFSDVGELPRIGGMRLRARGYMQYFVSRGRFSENVADARPGDLIVWNNGAHIGIYIGDGKAISALVNPWGVSIHSLYSINEQVTQVLLVNWGGGDAGNTDGNANGNGNGNQGPGGQGIVPARANAVATGTMNVRITADPGARILGWIGRGGYFRIVDQGRSPGGYLWYEVVTKSGKHGWVYSRWVTPLT